jgi:hypothetical protein
MNDECFKKNSEIEPTGGFFAHISASQDTACAHNGKQSTVNKSLYGSMYPG